MATTVAQEGESMTNKWEVICRQQLNGQALPHFEFQQEVAKDMVKLSRMVRDLGRAVKF